MAVFFRNRTVTAIPDERHGVHTQVRRLALLALGGAALALGVAPAPVRAAEEPADVRMNMEKVGDKSVICAGDSVTFTLTTRLLGGAPGIELRDVQAVDSNLPGITLVPGGPHFVAASDVGGDGVLAFIDANNDGRSDEEFVWTYTLAYSETTTNVASDSAAAWFVDPMTGAETFIGNASADDSWLVTVDPAACPTTTTASSPTTAAPTTTEASSSTVAPTSTLFIIEPPATTTDPLAGSAAAAPTTTTGGASAAASTTQAVPRALPVTGANGNTGVSLLVALACVAVGGVIVVASRRPAEQAAALNTPLQ